MLAVHTTYQELSRSTCSNSRLRSTIMCFLRAVWWRDKLIQIWLWIILSSRAGNMVAYAGSMSPHPLVSTLCAVCNAAGARTRYCVHVKITRLNIDTDKWNECMVYRWYFWSLIVHNLLPWLQVCKFLRFSNRQRSVVVSVQLGMSRSTWKYS
jgi:hypothetical protein